MAHMTTSNIEMAVVDKRKALSASADNHTHMRSQQQTLFTANAAGTTTTIVGANAAPGTNDANVLRRNEKFVLYNNVGSLKEEKIFTVTGVAVAASTTVTFTPAAAVVTANGDVARFINMDDFMDEDSLDDRLLAIGYPQSNINQMTQNDKIYAVRLATNPDSI